MVFFMLLLCCGIDHVIVVVLWCCLWFDVVDYDNILNFGVFVCVFVFDNSIVVGVL